HQGPADRIAHTTVRGPRDAIAAVLHPYLELDRSDVLGPEALGTRHHRQRVVGEEPVGVEHPDYGAATIVVGPTDMLGEDPVGGIEGVALAGPRHRGRPGDQVHAVIKDHQVPYHGSGRIL